MGVDHSSGQLEPLGPLYDRETGRQLRKMTTQERAAERAAVRAWRAEEAAEVEMYRDELTRLWNERDQFDSNCYLYIPDFEVSPVSMEDHRFSGPILYWKNPLLAEPVRGMVRTARALLRVHVSTMAEYHAALQDALDVLYPETPGELERDLSEVQRAALLYHTIIDDLRTFDSDSAHHLWNGQVTLARAADTLSSWAHEGAAAAAERLRERNRQNASGARAKVTAGDVAHFAREAGYPGALKWDDFLVRSAARFHTSESTIRRRYEAAKEAGLLS